MNGEARTQDDADFEVVRFVARPVGRQAALLELEGRFRDAPAPRRPVLVVEAPGEHRREVEALAAATGEDPWRATFAVARARVRDARFLIDGGRRLLVELPVPDLASVAPVEADEHTRLARTINELRSRVDAERAAAQAARAEATSARAEADAAREEARAARAERDAVQASGEDSTATLDPTEVATAPRSRSVIEPARGRSLGAPAEIGARMIEPGRTPPRGLPAPGAVLALAAMALALLVVLGVPPL